MDLEDEERSVEEEEMDDGQYDSERWTRDILLNNIIMDTSLAFQIGER